MSALSFEAPPELIEQIAARAVEMLRTSGSPDPEVTGAGWLRGAERIAAYIDAPTSRVYALANCNPPRIPVERDGSALVAHTAELDSWVRAGGGKRP